MARVSDKVIDTAICQLGKAYNTSFQAVFGDYRLSRTITEAHGGVEPPWLRKLHERWEHCSKEGLLPITEEEDEDDRLNASHGHL